MTLNVINIDSEIILLSYNGFLLFQQMASLSKNLLGKSSDVTSEMCEIIALFYKRYRPICARKEQD